VTRSAVAAPLTPPPASGNSRESAEKAGWRAEPPRHSREWRYGTAWERMLKRRKRTRWVNFFWISPTPLLASVNDKIAKGLDDLVNDVRPRWVAAQRAGGRLGDRPRVTAHSDMAELSFLLVGDPGEQDASQYAVVAPMLAVGDDTDFMVIDSDVIYPAGDINDYVDGFFLPYERYRSPIYAIPGNHDWYDGLNGFMFHFCGAESLPPVAYRGGSYTWKQRLAQALWRKPAPPQLPELLYERRARAQLQQESIEAAWEPAQPAPYFTIETPSLLIVCIDTGITGKLDREQGDWLRDLSRGDARPKLLITGKPIYVDGEYHPGEIDWGPDGYPGIAEEVGGLRTVDDVVREPAHRYVAAIGGDVHNYQRYSVLVNDAGSGFEGPPPGLDTAEESLRRLEYVVAGGGGAYLSATHRVPRVRLDPRDNRKRPLDRRLPRNVAAIEEEGFWCYPLRGDSLARFVRRFVPGFAIALGIGLGVVLAMVAVFFGVLDGFDERLEQLDDARLTNVLWVLPATLALTGGIVAGAIFASNRLARPGFRTLTATTLALGGGLLVVVAGGLLGDAWDEWIWRLALTSLLAVVVPVVGVVTYYLVRDFLPQSVRIGIGLAVAIAVAAVFIGRRTDVAVPVLVGVALIALWASVTILSRLQRFALARWLPVVAGATAAVLALIGLQEVGWITAGALASFAGAVLWAAVLVLGSGWRAVPALPWLWRADIDPDMCANWLAGELDMTPTHATAREAKPDAKTKALAKLTYRSWPYRKFMSELAEATTPPFFKSFLRLDVTPTELTITAYGVTGWLEDETEPTVEDRVTIALKP
jgi:hypothetical protein